LASTTSSSPDALTGRYLPGRFPQLFPPFGGHVGRQPLLDIVQRHRVVSLGGVARGLFQWHG